MKRIAFTIASAALGLSLCLGASASTLPLSVAPASSQLGANPNDVIIITEHVIVVTRPVLQNLQNVNQSAEFDRTN